MTKQLVIGYGNPLRGDDGVGFHVAGLLAAESLSDTVEIRACHQLTPELVEHLRDAAQVIFVDASEGHPPGTITLQVVASEDVPGAFTHNVTPGSLLAAAQSWYGCQPECYLLSVNGEGFDLSERLSPTVTAVLPVLLAQIHRLLKQGSET